LVFEKEVLNVISANTPQEGYKERKKKEFLREINEVMQVIPGN
jgi:hypothetical protein